MSFARAKKRLGFAAALVVTLVSAGMLLAQPAGAASPPTVTAINPSTGANNGAVSITIAGTGFAAGDAAGLHLAGQTDIAATNINVSSPVSMSATFDLTAAATGAWDVTVTDPVNGTGSKSGAFTITQATPTATSTSPTSGERLPSSSTTMDVSIIGTNFARGTLSSAFSGTAVTVNSTTFVDATHVTSNITIAAGAPVGKRDVTVTVNGASATCTQCFNVYAGPVPSGSSPAAAANASPVQVTVTGVGFAQGNTVSLKFSGQTITGSNVQFVSSTSLKATFDITNASPAAWDIAVSDSLNTNVCAGCFTVTASAPTAGSAAPNAGGQGATNLNVSIIGTNFARGAVASFSGSGITVGSTTFVDANHVTASVSISGTAATGARSITITNTDAQAATCAGCFTINAAPAAVSASPNSRGQGGATQNVSITGNGFLSGVNLAATFASGITTNSTTFVSATQITANVTVSSSAPTGPGSISIVNGDGGAATCNACFTINAGPSITTGSSWSLGQGAVSQNIAITGSNFASGSLATISGSGVTVNSTTFNSPTSLTVNVSVAANAPAGSSNLTVTNTDAGTTTCSKCFSVTGAPVVASASPSNLGQGASAQDVTITGSGFGTGGGATASFSASGVTVNKTTVNSATQIVANITISGTAATGAGDITITNGDGGVGKCTGCFTINPAPTATSADPSSRGQGATGQLVTITGTGFQNGATVSFAGAGISVEPSTTTFVDSAHIQVKIDVASNATAGVASNITVQNPDKSAVATCTNCFMVHSAPTVQSSSPNALGVGASQQTVTVTGVNFSSGAQVVITGAGIVMGSTTLVDAAHLSVTVTVQSNAVVGSAHDIRVTNGDAGIGVCAGCFTIDAPPVVTNAASPVGQGASSVNVPVTGSNFVSGAAVSFSGGDITVNSTTFTDSAHLTANISVAANATVSARDVTVTNPDQGASKCAGCFNVSSGPTVTSVAPSSMGQGAGSQIVTVTGSNFAAGAAVSFANTGITVNTTSVTDSTHLSVNISISSTASTGIGNVTVTNSDGGSRSCACFTVNAAPTVSSVSPNSRGQGASSQSVSLTGTGFVTGATVAFSGSGIAVTSSSFVDAAHLTVVVNVDPTAPANARSITVTNPDKGVGGCTGCFTVNAGPGVSSSSPSAATNSGPVTVTITGTSFVSGATVSLQHAGQPDIAGTSVVFNSATSLKATFDITYAAPAAWSIRVTNPDGGSSTCPNCFTVAGSAPAISGVWSNVGGQGASRDVTVTGSNFAQGAVVSIGGTGVTAGPTTFVDGSHVKVTLSIGSSAPTGGYDITVTNIDSQAGTCASCFTVDLAPTAATVSPASRGQGATSQVISITGSNFVSGLTASFTNIGVLVSSVSVVDGSHVNVTINVGGAAPVGVRDITLRNSDGGSATCSACFTVNAAPSATSLLPASLGQNASSQTITITGNAFQNGATVSFSGSGVAINSSSVTDATHISLNVSVAPAAAIGARDVSVSNPDGGTIAVCTGCFTINVGPAVSSIAPGVRGQGASSQTLTITGSNFTSSPQVSFSGAGITVNSTSMIDSTHLSVNVSVASNAASGASDMRVINSDGGQVTCGACFTVDAAPSISSVSPGSLGQGAASQVVTLTGSGFVSGATVLVSGSDVAVNSVSVPDSKHVTVTLTVAKASTTGARNVTITNPDGGTPFVCNACFTVNAAPVLSSIGPNSIGAGAPAQDVTLNETGIENGAHVTFGEGIVVNSVTILDATHASANITVSPSASTGSRDVTVSNPDGGTPALCSSCFNVLPAGLLGTLSLQTSPSSGPYGTGFMLSGMLECNGSPVPFDSVKVNDTTIWTDANGAWSAVAHPSSNTTFSATWPGNSQCLGGATSQQSSVKVGVAVSMSYSRSSLPVGQNVYIWGRVAPSKAGKIVRLQIYNGTAHVWNEVTTQRLTPQSSYSFPYRQSSTGKRMFRIVYYTQDNVNTWGVSKYLFVKWY